MKRKNYLIGKTDITKFDEKGVLGDDKPIMVYTSEKRLLRMFGNSRTVLNHGIQMEELIADNFIIVDFDKDIDNPFIKTYVIEHGFIHKAKRWYPAVQSGAQGRTGKITFTCLDVDNVRAKLTYNAKFNTHDIPSKVETRVANGTSSTVEAGTDYTYRVIDDVSYNRPTKAYMMNNDKIELRDVDIAINISDGMGTIEVLPAMKIAYRYEIISKKEYMFFVAKYTDIDAIRNNPKLLRIFNKVPKAWQVRYAGAKGMLVIYPHSRHGYKEDIMFTKSMWKYEPNAIDIPLEIADHAKQLKDLAYLNYQFIQALELSPIELITLAKNALKDIDEGILVDYDRAMKFLGMHERIGSEDNVENKVVSKVTAVLAHSVNTIRDPWVQKQLMKLLKKFVTNMAWGRIPISGSFVYIIGDPRYLFGIDGLKEGEYYFNGTEDSYAGFRSPLTHSSEVARINTTCDDGLWFLNDLLIMNQYDTTLPRMGGADTDGDQILLTNDKLLVNRIKMDYLVYDPGMSGTKVKIDKQSRIKHYISTASRSSVGSITDMATTWTDLALHNGNRGISDNIVRALRVYQGQEIDSIKTGYKPEVPVGMRTKMVPHWVKGRRKAENRDVSKKKTEYKSNSPIGKLYDFIQDYWGKRAFSKASAVDMITMFTNHIDIAFINKQLVDQIKYLERSYRIELAKLSELKANDLSDDEFDTQLSMIFSKYESLMSSIDADKRIVSALAYQIAYCESSSKSVSFPWSCCFEGMLELLAENNSAYKLIKIPRTTDEVVTIRDSVLVVNMVDEPINKLYIGDCIEDGDYEVKHYASNSYIRVKNNFITSSVYKKPVSDITKYHGKTYQFHLTGYSYINLDANNVLDLMASNNYKIAMIKSVDDQVVIYTGTHRIGVIRRNDKFYNNELIGTQLEVIEHESADFISKKTNAKQLRKAIQLTCRVIGTVNEEDYDQSSPTVVARQKIVDQSYYEFIPEDSHEYDYINIDDTPQQTSAPKQRPVSRPIAK